MTASTSVATTVHAPHAGVLIAMSTAPDEATAMAIAQALLEAHVAACVSMVPRVRSVYRWQGKVEQADEWMLLIKTAADRRADLKHVLRAAHPYELPELLFIDAIDGLPAYLQWVIGETQPSSSQAGDGSR